MSHHPPFKQVEASRPDWPSREFVAHKTASPDWKAGSGKNQLAPTFGEEQVQFDPAELSGTTAAYKLLISAVTPRPIALVSTANEEGKLNLAPFSFFNAAAADPPCVMFAITHVNATPKDTYHNILRSKEFSISIISEHFIEAANYTSIDTPDGISEWAASGLTPVANKLIKPPRVKESGFSMECELLHHYDVLKPGCEKPTATVIIGEVKMFHVASSLVQETTTGPLVNTKELAPIGRLGGINYTRVIQSFEVERPAWKEEKVQEELKHVL